MSQVVDATARLKRPLVLAGGLRRLKTNRSEYGRGWVISFRNSARCSCARGISNVCFAFHQPGDPSPRSGPAAARNHYVGSLTGKFILNHSARGDGNIVSNGPLLLVFLSRVELSGRLSVHAFLNSDIKHGGPFLLSFVLSTGVGLSVTIGVRSIIYRVPIKTQNR